MKEIPLSNNPKCKHYGKYKAIIDDVDFDLIAKHKWRVYFNGNKSKIKKPYASAMVKDNNGKYVNVSMHRMLLKVIDSKIFVDHKDNNGLNNQKENLRTCTHSQNQMNKRPYGTSKYLGVFWHTSKRTIINKNGLKKEYTYSKWMAGISIKGKRVHIGYYKSEVDAAKAYDSFAKIHHGEFANLNFK